MRRLIAAAAAVAALVLGALAVAGADDGGGADQREVRMVFDNAFGLVEGGDFRIGGVRAGQTSSFDVLESKSGPPKAIVKATIERTGGTSELRRDATCTIRPQSLVGEYYVDCQPGSSRERLTRGPGGAAAARPRARSRRTWSTTCCAGPRVSGCGCSWRRSAPGWPGGPADIQAVLRRSFPGLRETRKTLRILGDQNRTIKQFIADADTVVTRLESRRADVTDFIRESRGAAETGASRRAELREGVRRLPGFLAELRPSMAELSNLARQGSPLAGELRRSAPDATTLLQRLGPFSEAALPALRGLGDAAVPATQALRESGTEVATLRALARDAPATVKPLRQTLQTLDDRRRAVDNDSRAALTAPPAPDPTSAVGGRGFTGFESLVNYFFWQTMTTNGFDAIGHQLRVGATVSKCSPYRNEPPTDADSEQLFKDCNSWLGPRQPGINAPDPSVPGSAAAKARAAKGSAPSTPRVELPPGVKKLIERSGGDTRADRPDRAGAGAQGPAGAPGPGPPAAHRRAQPDRPPGLPAQAMNRNRTSQALVASPVLVGAVTLLVVIVGVFLAYNANSGLPFVPTYTLKAELPSGAKLVKGNEVRVGGFRVGAVSRIDGAVRRQGGRRRAIAVVEMQLDKTVEPLSADTRLRVRPRSALGVKYIEITPGTSKRELAAGATVPLAQGSQSNDFEDAFATFDRETRPNLRQATEGFGNAFTGRGPSVNQALAALPPLLDDLRPVMATLNDPGTDLAGFVRNLGAVTAQVAPVAPQAAELARTGADTFAALNRSPQALADTIAATPPTLAVGTRALRRSRPVVAQTAILFRKLRPVTRELPATLPPISDALRVGTPVLRRSLDLSDRLRTTSVALRDLIRDPNTQRSLGNLRTAVALLKPTLNFVAPVPDGLQLRQLLLPPAGRAPVPARRRAATSSSSWSAP